MLQRLIYLIGWIFVALGVSTTTSDAIIVPAALVFIGLICIKFVSVTEGRK